MTEPLPPPLSPPSSSRTSHHQDFPGFEQTSLLSYMQLADTKASVFMFVSSGAIAYIVGHWGLDWLRASPAGWHLVLLAVSTLFLGLSAIYAFAVIVPRFGPPQRGLVHFAGVIQHPSPEEYAAEVLSKSATELYAEQIGYCYQLARICARKYRLLHRSLLTGVLGYAAFLAALIWL